MYDLAMDVLPHLQARRRLETVDALVHAIPAAIADEAHRGALTAQLRRLERTARPTVRTWTGPGEPPGWDDAGVGPEEA